MSPDEARRTLEQAELICDARTVAAAIGELAVAITAVLGNSNPLVLVVMRGGVYIAGQILPLLRFPLDLDYVELTRYGISTSGGAVCWKVRPPDAVAGRAVLVLDDILDAGETLAALRDCLVRAGALSVRCAVLADKQIGAPKPIIPDFVGLRLPDRFVFGCGMDVSGAWRNLPAIYAVKA